MEGNAPPLSSDEEEDLLLYYFVRSRLQRHRRRRYWVHPYNKNNYDKRLFIATQELTVDDNKFLNCYRMSKNTFKELVELVRPHILKQNTNIREAVSPEERVLITMRYLATGNTYTSLGLYFARRDTTISEIIANTTKVIWETLRDTYLKVPTTQEWVHIANRFYELWQLPNCVGAINGKHIRIQTYPNSGSTNFNYKGYNSVVLMGCADADGNFTLFETGFAGRNSDGGIFQTSRLGQFVLGNNNIPKESRLPHDNNIFPYYFAADNAFPLKRNIMRPFPERIINNKKRIFNYRLSRGKKKIECIFGMITQKFQVLMTPIRCKNYDTINYIIKCICVLHNFIHKKEGIQYEMNIQNIYANNSSSIAAEHMAPDPDGIIDDTSSALQLRDYLANYFLKPNCSVPWQWNHCV